MTRYRIPVLLTVVAAAFSPLALAVAQTQPATPPQKIVIEADGTVQEPVRSVPLSTFLTPEARSYVTDHLNQMQDLEMVKQDNGVPRFMLPYLEQDRAMFALNRTDGKISGVHVLTYVPKSGIIKQNDKRVLINLHGGGFSGCWPGCAELESMPLSAMMGIKVVSVDYREGPEYKFPAASEDVAAVYKELLRTYPAKNIGVYGCSAGGMLTAMALAWFQTHDLPTPGAAGIFCASAGSFGGDASYIAFPLGEARIPTADPARNQLGYFSGADLHDPLVSPAESSAVLGKFPPTLILTGTRDFAMSGAIHTDIQLTQAGVDSELHVWDGLFHGFFYNANVPESKEAFAIAAKFFNRHLGNK